MRQYRGRHRRRQCCLLALHFGVDEPFDCDGILYLVSATLIPIAQKKIRKKCSIFVVFYPFHYLHCIPMCVQPAAAANWPSLTRTQVVRHKNIWLLMRDVAVVALSTPQWCTVHTRKARSRLTHHHHFSSRLLDSLADNIFIITRDVRHEIRTNDQLIDIRLV